MAYVGTKAAVAVVAAIPIALQWNENRNLKRELSIANGQAMVGGHAKSDQPPSSNLTPRVGGREMERAQLRGPAIHSSHARAMDWQRALLLHSVPLGSHWPTPNLRMSTSHHTQQPVAGLTAERVSSWHPTFTTPQAQGAKAIH